MLSKSVEDMCKAKALLFGCGRESKLEWNMWKKWTSHAKPSFYRIMYEFALYSVFLMARLCQNALSVSVR
jgi:hypothetical protein